MKQLKPVIITAVVMVALLGVIFGLVKLFPATDPGVGDPQSGGATSSLLKIVDRSSSDVRSVEITADTGESFAIDFNEGKATLRNADPNLTYVEEDLSTLSGFVALLVALEEVPDGGEDALFGFDAPQRVIKVTFAGGEPITLIIGDETPLGTGVYIKRADRPNVYTIGGSTMEILMKLPFDYRDYLLFSGVSTSEMIENLVFERPGRDTITLVHKSDSELESLEGEAAQIASSFRMTSPVVSDTAYDKVTTEFLDKVIKIKGAALVEDYPKDLAQYGLDKPARLRFETTLGTKVSLLIGSKAPSGGRYVMPEGTPSVIVTEEDMTFLDISHADIMTQLIWFKNSIEVSEITYDLPDGERHTLKLSSDGKSLKGYYDGRELSSENASNLFLLSVRFTLAGEYTSDMTYAESVCKMTMRTTDGKTTTLDLRKINDRRYAAIIDGAAPRFFVSVNEVTELLDAFGILKSDGDIPDMF